MPVWRRVGAVSWRWELIDDHGQAREPDSGQTFPSQSDAETWLGESWRELRDAGVAAVVLLEDSREVYGPMSLNA
jgi:hypothetical protein